MQIPDGEMPDTEREWQDWVRRTLRVELARRAIGYVELSDRLRAMGIQETPKNLSNKVARGMFTAAFFCACLSAIGCDRIRLDDGH